MGKRGDSLREHILWSAKEVFLEMGFERASMDAVAARAETSKRTLYAHFESKEKLFLAVIDMVQALFREKLRSPAEFKLKPADALTQFCARYLQALTYDAWVRMCRISMAESERFPEQAERYFNMLFVEVQARLAAYLHDDLGLTVKASTAEAERLLGQVLYPRLLRVWFGVEAAIPSLDPDRLAPGFDTRPIRRAVNELLERTGKA